MLLRDVVDTGADRALRYAVPARRNAKRGARPNPTGAPEPAFRMEESIANVVKNFPRVIAEDEARARAKGKQPAFKPGEGITVPEPDDKVFEPSDAPPRRRR